MMKSARRNLSLVHFFMENFVKNMSHQKCYHTIPPIFDSNSEILILGSFPSVKSRESYFYYAHNKNRFWKVISTILGDELPKSDEDKKSMLLRHHIALWDVVAECMIYGSSDMTIRDVKANDISLILDNSNIKAIYTNGKTAQRLYEKFLSKKTDRVSFCLPSTSPANASYSLERLISEWKIITKYI